jgi:hypothetical protein
MFNILIESGSQASELKRRGSFFLCTTVAYGLLFTGGGVASIYAYDAHLDEQATEMTILSLAPALTTEILSPPVKRSHAPNAASHSIRPTQPILYDSIDNPRKVPDKTSTIAAAIPAFRPNASFGPTVGDPPLPSGPAAADGGSFAGSGKPVSVEEPTPPPAPMKRQAPQIVRVSGILNGRAIELPKPAYPAFARQLHLSSLVSVQVLIDETGRVLSAHAVSGHPLFIPGSIKAAYEARFSPTTVGETPVKVSGIINYNFVLE